MFLAPGATPKSTSSPLSKTCVAQRLCAAAIALTDTMVGLHMTVAARVAKPTVRDSTQTRTLRSCQLNG